MTRSRVGVFPRAAGESRAQLLGALARALPVDFHLRAAGEAADLDAAVVFGDDRTVAEQLSALGIPTLFAAHVPGVREGPSASLVFSTNDALDGRLRGRTLARGPGARHDLAEPLAGDDVLARTAAHAWWVRRGGYGAPLHDVAAAPAELAPGERLSHNLDSERFAPSIPLVHFLREVSGYDAWDRPPLQASFIVDDPNLRRMSYGYLNYRALAEHAERHGYHLGVAMIPLDAGVGRSSVVGRHKTTSALSVLVHGNNHSKWELARPRPSGDHLQQAAQALRRMAGFETRWGLPVTKVMVPPHGRCSIPMMDAMLAVGFEAVSYHGPTGDEESDPVNGFAPADLHIGGGLPGFHRWAFDVPRDVLVLVSFLDQPIILYGHHEDLASGLDPLADAAARVDELGDVRWRSVADIARAHLALRREGGTIAIRPYSRRVRVRVPEEATEVVVVPPAGARWDRDQVLLRWATADNGHAHRIELGQPEKVRSVRGGTVAEVSIVPSTRVSTDDVPPPRREPWLVVRRRLTEGRDRLQPVLHR